MLYRTSTNPPVFGLRREIDRLFEDTFGRDAGNAWTPAVDIRENQNELRLDVELPGIKSDEVEITADNGILTIRGEKQTERKEDDDSRYHIVERVYGSFSRSFQLPPGIDETRIDATFDNGILSIHIPKAALPQPKKIQIKSSSAGEVGSRAQHQMSSGGTQQKRTGTAGSGGGAQSQSQTPMAAGGAQGSSAKGGRSKAEPNS